MTGHKSTYSFVWLSAAFIGVLVLALWVQNFYLLFVPFAILLFFAGWQQLSVAFLLLLASIAFSFEHSFGGVWGTDIPDEGLMLLVSFLGLGYWLYKRESVLDKKVISHPLMILLFIHLVWIAAAVISSSLPLLSVKYLLAKTWYIAAFVFVPLMLFREKKWIKASAAVIAVSLVIITGIILYRHNFTDFSFATVNEALAPFFRNHVNYSSMLVCGVPLFIAFYVLTKDRRMQWLFICIIALLCTAVFFSYARGAWIALLLGIITYGLIKKNWLVGAYITAIVIVTAGVFWLKSNDRYLQYSHDFKKTIFHENFQEHLVATYQLRDASTAERFYRWIAGVRMIKYNWVTGHGPSTFYERYKPYAVPAYRTWVSYNPEHSTIHNYFLLLAVEQGIPGLIIFLVLLGAMFWYAQYLYRRIQDRFYKMVVMTAGVIVVMIATVNFLSDLIETDKIGSLFFLCLAALVMADFNSKIRKA